jgi:hypothetical protein
MRTRAAQSEAFPRPSPRGLGYDRNIFNANCFAELTGNDVSATSSP